MARGLCISAIAIPHQASRALRSLAFRPGTDVLPAGCRLRDDDGMGTEQARERRNPFRGRDGRAVIVRIVLASRRPMLLRDVPRPEHERHHDPDAEPGRGRLGLAY